MQFFKWNNKEIGDFDVLAVLTENEKSKLAGHFHAYSFCCEGASLPEENKYFYFVDSKQKTISPMPFLSMVFGGQYNDWSPYGEELYNFVIDYSDYKLIRFGEEKNYIDSFSTRTTVQLKYYVYALIDPRDEKIFYIGKGNNNRIFDHEKEEKINKAKNERIESIEKSGMSVKRVIIHYGLETEEKAYAAETALINLINWTDPGLLTNEVAGHDSHPADTVEKIEFKLSAEPLKKEEIKHNLLIIKINSLFNFKMTEDEIANAVRGHWRINVNKASKVDYLLAVYHGLVVGVYENMRWYPSDVKTSYYPRLNDENLRLYGRKYCTCEKVTNSPYMGKNILAFVKNTQNPISYIWKDDIKEK